MPLFSFEGRFPQVHPEAWVAPTATLVGDVVVEAGASIWYGAVLRADFGPIICSSLRNESKPSRIACGVMLCSHRRRIGLPCALSPKAYCRISLKIS